MRTLIKQGALRALRSAGLFRIAAGSKMRRERLLILCYHGISLRDEERWEELLYISPRLFRQRLETLRRFGARVLELGEALRRLRERSLPPRSVVLTFDDGFYDFHRNALPLLEEFGYPCTLYLTTHYCRYRFPIFNLVVPYVLWKSGRPAMDLSRFGAAGEVGIASREERLAAVRMVASFAEKHGMDTAAKNDLAAEIAEAAGIDYGELVKSRILQIMSPEEAAEAHAAGVDLELHTHRHRTPPQRELFLREIRDNRARIRELTGRDAAHFCYPSGQYASEFLPWLRECAVESATTCDPALAGPASDPLLLPRLLDHSRITEVEFESWLCGLVA